MTALSTLVPALKRELAVPGTFTDTFPSTTDEDLAESLADGFAEAQLYGFFPDLTLTEGLGDQEGEWVTSEELSGSGAALVIIFTSMRIIRANLRSMLTSERYKAGPAEFEIQRSANLLRDELKFLKQRLDDLVAGAKSAARAASTVKVFDGYLARGGAITETGLFRYEYRGVGVTKFVPPSFNEAMVLDGIRKAMGFGEPTREEDKVTFHFNARSQAVGDADDEGVPFDPNDRITNTREALVVDCVVEYQDRAARAETFGVVVPARVVLTLLDPDWQKVKGFAYVKAGGDIYWRSTVQPPVALGSIDVWSVICTAEGES